MASIVMTDDDAKKLYTETGNGTEGEDEVKVPVKPEDEQETDIVKQAPTDESSNVSVK